MINFYFNDKNDRIKFVDLALKKINALHGPELLFESS